MRTFVIERTVPGAAQLTQEDLRGIAQTSNDAIATIGRPYRWVHTYVAGDKMYCVHEAEDADAVREHARAGGFPCDAVTEVANIVDGSWAAN